MTANPFWRSLLFVSNPKHAAKAGERGADGIILDLEDAIALADKPRARAELAATVAMIRAQGVDVLVRINAPWLMAIEDLKVAVMAGVSAIVVPKAEGAGRLQVLSDLIGEMEMERGLPVGAIALVPQVESSQALVALDEMLAAQRVAGLALGPEDFSLSLGVKPTAECLDLPCQMIALAAARVGKMALAMPISIAAYQDLDAWAAAARRARAMGCTGAMAIHPAQVAGIATSFAPSEAERAEAEAILTAWDQRGDRGVIALGQKMIDLPIVNQAKRLLGRPL